MAQMNRNINLEEIDSDALFGIDALKNQTFFQKVVFFGNVLLGVLVNVCLPVFFDTPKIVCVFIFLALLGIGVGFGCNYTEEMTYGKYLYYFFFRPRKELTYQSTEDMQYVRGKAKEIKKEEELTLQRKHQADPREQRKLLVKLIVFVIALVIGIGAVFVYSGVKERNDKHHTVEVNIIE